MPTVSRRKAQKSIVFSILARFWIFARVRILSRFFASVFVLVKACRAPNCFDFIAFVLGLLFSAGLVVLCWIKAMQITRTVDIAIKVSKEQKDKPEQGTTQ